METSLVYCIKDFSEDSSFNYFNFIKNKTYTILYDETDVYTPIQIIDDDNNKLKFHELSNFNKEERNKHFISLKESRKIKLCKLSKKVID